MKNRVQTKGRIVIAAMAAVVVGLVVYYGTGTTTLYALCMQVDSLEDTVKIDRYTIRDIAGGNRAYVVEQPGSDRLTAVLQAAQVTPQFYCAHHKPGSIAYKITMQGESKTVTVSLPCITQNGRHYELKNSETTYAAVRDIINKYTKK